MLYDDLVTPGSYICHHGIKGQKWGVRRYQNPDGSLTEEGKRRYNSLIEKAKVEANSIMKRTIHIPWNRAADKINNGLTDQYNDEWIKKHGENDFENPEYYNGYNELWMKLYNQEVDRYYNEVLRNTRNYRLAQQIVGRS